jgi:hypothetical protein
MEVTNDNTIIAYLLALRDFSGILSDAEKEKLRSVAKDLDIQPKAWKSNLETDLIQTIQSNLQLSRSYQSYKEQLDRLGAIPIDLLLTTEKNERSSVDTSPLIAKGMTPVTPATGYEQQLNNVVIVVNQSDRPEQKIQEYTFLDRVKEFLNQNSP